MKFSLRCSPVVRIVAVLLVTACSKPAPRPCDVLLIVVDTLRQDHLGCYGGSRPTSPAIDALAADAVRFDRAYATAPWTGPSVASMLTGLYPGTHGVTSVTRMPDDVVTLGERLQARGYQTGAVISHWLIGSEFNFQQGFDRFQEWAAAISHDKISTPSVTKEARRMLEAFAAEDRPFFLFVHYFDPHYHYLRHSEFGFAAPSAGRLEGTETIDQLRQLGSSMTAEEVDFIRALYDEEIRFTDDGIDQLLDALRDTGRFDNTLIVFTSDHGEEFLTHGWIGHTRTLYEELVRIPLIVRPPGGPRSGSAVVESLVSLTSLTPTVLEFAGIVPQDETFQGESLLPLLDGGAVAGAAELFVEVDFVPPKRTAAGLAKTAHKKGLVTERYKIIRDDASGRIEVYDVAIDRDELDDLAPRRKDLVERLLPRLERVIAAYRQGTEAEVEQLTDQELEKLRSLGYLEN